MQARYRQRINLFIWPKVELPLNTLTSMEVDVGYNPCWSYYAAVIGCLKYTPQPVFIQVSMAIVETCHLPCLSHHTTMDIVDTHTHTPCFTHYSCIYMHCRYMQLHCLYLHTAVYSYCRHTLCLTIIEFTPVVNTSLMFIPTYCCPRLFYIATPCLTQHTAVYACST